MSLKHFRIYFFKVVRINMNQNPLGKYKIIFSYFIKTLNRMIVTIFYPKFLLIVMCNFYYFINVIVMIIILYSNKFKYSS